MSVEHGQPTLEWVAQVGAWHQGASVSGMWSIRLSLVRACVCCVARVCGSSTRICSRCITRMVCGWCPVSCFRALMCCVCSPHPERNGRGRDVTGGQTESASGESAARKWLQARWHAGWKMERRETTRDSREWRDGGDRRGRCRGVKINYYAAPVGWRRALASSQFFFARPDWPRVLCPPSGCVRVAVGASQVISSRLSLQPP